MTAKNPFTDKLSRTLKLLLSQKKARLQSYAMKVLAEQKAKSSYLLTTTLSQALVGWRQYLGDSLTSLLEELVAQPSLQGSFEVTGTYSNTDLLSGSMTSFFLKDDHIFLAISCGQEHGLLVQLTKTAITKAKSISLKRAIPLIAEKSLRALAALMNRIVG